MALSFDMSQRVGEIVAAFPGASNLFKAYGIDFCCGGGRTLGEALQARGITEGAFLEELHAAYQEARHRRKPTDVDWRVAPLGDLVRRIVAVHHAYLKQELPLLSGFVSKIDRVHGDRHPELRMLNRLFHQLKAELEAHLVVEETELFPLIEAYARTGAQQDLARVIDTLERLETDHQEAGQLLAAMREATGGYMLPADACRTYTISFQKLIDLESDMFVHVHLENNILFRRLRSAMLLDPGAEQTT